MGWDEIGWDGADSELKSSIAQKLDRATARSRKSSMAQYLSKQAANASGAGFAELLNG